VADQDDVKSNRPGTAPIALYDAFRQLKKPDGWSKASNGTTLRPQKLPARQAMPTATPYLFPRLLHEVSGAEFASLGRVVPADIKGEAARKAIDELIRAGLLEEVRAAGSLPAEPR
jgi:hypothetical protein